MKRTAHRLSAMAYMLSLIAVMSKGYATAEIKRKRDNWSGHSHRTRRNPGAFGGPKRAGIKLVRRMARCAVARG